jgi:hypothetical protein
MIRSHKFELLPGSMPDVCRGSKLELINAAAHSHKNRGTLNIPDSMSVLTPMPSSMFSYHRSYGLSTSFGRSQDQSNRLFTRSRTWWQSHCPIGLKQTAGADVLDTSDHSTGCQIPVVSARDICTAQFRSRKEAGLTEGGGKNNDIRRRLADCQSAHSCTSTRSCSPSWSGAICHKRP